MSTYREAIQHARSGGTIKRGEKIIRLLTQKEADAHALAHNPSRRVVHETYKEKDEKGVEHEHQRPLVKDGQIVVEEHGEGRPQRLGLFDMSSGEPVEFRPTEDDMLMPVELDEDGKEKPRVLRTDWEILKDEPSEASSEGTPEPVSPESVDQALAETVLDDDFEGAPHGF